MGEKSRASPPAHPLNISLMLVRQHLPLHPGTLVANENYTKPATSCPAYRGKNACFKTVHRLQILDLIFDDTDPFAVLILHLLTLINISKSRPRKFVTRTRDVRPKEKHTPHTPHTRHTSPRQTKENTHRTPMPGARGSLPSGFLLLLSHHPRRCHRPLLVLLVTIPRLHWRRRPSHVGGSQEVEHRRAQNYVSAPRPSNNPFGNLSTLQDATTFVTRPKGPNHRAINRLSRTFHSQRCKTN